MAKKKSTKKKIDMNKQTKAVSKKISTAKKRIDSTGARIKRFIKQNPKKSVAAAAALAAGIVAATTTAIKKLKRK